MKRDRYIAIGCVIITFIVILVTGVTEVQPKRSNLLAISTISFDSTIVIAVDNNAISTTVYYGDSVPYIPPGVAALHSSSVVLHGDVNMSGTISAADIIYLMLYVYKGGPVPRYDTLGNRELYIWEDSFGTHVRYLKYYR